MAGAASAFTSQNTPSQMPAPARLNSRCTRAARRALRLAPTEDSIAVTQVPMFWPMTMGMAAPTVTCPLAARACNIPTEAELDWIIAVSTAPASTPSRGLPKAVNSCRNPSARARPDTAAVMISMPCIRTAKPSRAWPVSRRLPFPARYAAMPHRLSRGTKPAGRSSRPRTPPPSRPPRLSSQGVTVVPTLVPMMTPTAWRRVSIPEFTKPTTITMAADELCTAAVTARPVKNPAQRLRVIRRSRPSSRPPARRCSASAMICMPNRNRHSPPRAVNPSKMSMRASSPL